VLRQYADVVLKSTQPPTLSGIGNEMIRGLRATWWRPIECLTVAVVCRHTAPRLQLFASSLARANRLTLPNVIMLFWAWGWFA